MKATAIRQKRQTTLPSEVSEAAGLKPGDQVEWRYEAGEIRGRKLAPTEPRVIRARLVKRKGMLICEAQGVKIDPANIGRAVIAEREDR